jgi:hypothetical protein
MRSRRPIDATPEALAAWARGLAPLVREIRAFAEDATMPRGERRHSRTHLRKMLCRRLRDLESGLEALAPGAVGPFERPPCDVAIAPEAAPGG